MMKNMNAEPGDMATPVIAYRCGRCGYGPFTMMPGSVGESCGRCGRRIAVPAARYGRGIPRLPGGGSREDYELMCSPRGAPPMSGGRSEYAAWDGSGGGAEALGPDAVEIMAGLDASVLEYDNDDSVAPAAVARAFSSLYGDGRAHGIYVRTLAENPRGGVAIKDAHDGGAKPSDAEPGGVVDPRDRPRYTVYYVVPHAGCMSRGELTAVEYVDAPNGHHASESVRHVTGPGGAAWDMASIGGWICRDIGESRRRNDGE